MYCEACKIEFDENLRYCKWCGQALLDSPQPVQAQTCPACRSVVQPGLTFCTVCGFKLTLASGGGTQVMGSVKIHENQPGQPTEALNQHCTACGELLEPNTAYCKACGTPVYLEFNPSTPAYPHTGPAGSQMPSSPKTRFDSSTLPDLGTRIQNPELKGTIEMASGFVPEGLEGKDSGRIFSIPDLPEQKVEEPPVVETPIAKPIQETVKLDDESEDPSSQTIQMSSDVIEIGSLANDTGNITSQIDAETLQMESNTFQMESPTAHIDSETGEIDSDTFQIESDTTPIRPHQRSSLSTGKLTEDVWSEPEHPIALDKGRPTSVLHVSPVEEEPINVPSLDVNTPVAEPPVEAPPPADRPVLSPTADLFDFSEVHAVEQETIQQAAPGGTSEFASIPGAKDEFLEDNNTLIISSESLGLDTQTRKETQTRKSADAEPPQVIAPPPSDVPPPTTEMPSVRPTAPVGPVSTAGSMPVTGSHPAVTDQQSTAQGTGLNDAARNAFGMGEPIHIPANSPRDYPGQVPYSPDVMAARMMPPPTTAPRKSHLPILSIIIAVVLIGAAGLGVWYYSAIVAKKNAQNPIDVTINQPSEPTTPSQPDNKPTTPTAPAGMVFVPGGTYTIGTDTGDDLARPSHKVDIAPYFIDINEVTNADYKAFIDAKGRKGPEGWENGTYPAGKGNWPVTGVTWQDAVDYAQWAGKRLPTEAEWETAARGKEGNVYPWGNVWGEGMANLRSNSITEVGKFKAGASPFGLLDMIGNVWEWTSDSFNVYPGSSASTADLFESGVTYRVIRGGAYDRKENTEASYRGFVDASKGYPKTGFRCAKDAK